MYRCAEQWQLGKAPLPLPLQAFVSCLPVPFHFVPTCAGRNRSLIPTEKLE
jgi:hypothetical protein